MDSPAETEEQRQTATNESSTTHPEKAKEQAPSAIPEEAEQHKSKWDEPEGGFDATPIPAAPPGYTVRFTFHGAHNLPVADLNALSSDPFVVAQLNTALIPRHKEDPQLRRRTRTIPKQLDPVWEETWVVANVPASGFKLKCRIYDEDPANHDDRLGNAHVNVPRLDENWPGIHRQRYKIKKRMGSKRAYFIRFLGVCFGVTKQMNGELEMSVEVLGRTGEAEGVGENEGGRAFTVGPCWWTKHYSPMLGRLVGQKVDHSDDGDEDDEKSSKKKKKTTTYNFQANQFQLKGPVPAELYHRYVEFKPFVKAMFTAKGIRGYLLSKALHHQHARVYNFDRTTIYGSFEGPCEDMTRQFLDAVHYDRGGRIFTYVISLDGLMSFTETGKEFGVDMLSKHTLHSDVSVYIAWSGEFFIRRRRRHTLGGTRRPGSTGEEGMTTAGTDCIDANPSPLVSPDPSPEHSGYKDLSHVDVSAYELVIDNDSGTYRPNAKLLPKLQSYLEQCFPGLTVKVLDCQGDEKEMKGLKDRQREKKKAAQGDKRMVYMQRRSDSFSSSDEDELNALAEAADRDSANGTGSLKKRLKRDIGEHQNQKKDRLKRKWARKEKREPTTASGVLAAPAAEAKQKVGHDAPGGKQE